MSKRHWGTKQKAKRGIEKFCPKCEVPKPREDFGRDASRPDGRYTYCKACRKNPNRKDKEVLELAAKGLKVCTLCTKTKPFHAFEPDASKSLGVTSRCRKCRTEQKRRAHTDHYSPNSKPKKSLRDYTRWEVFEDDEFTCYLCEDVLSPATPHSDSKSLSIDHVMPLSRGGLDERANVRTACLSCNQKKRNMTLEEFWIRFQAA